MPTIELTDEQDLELQFALAARIAYLDERIAYLDTQVLTEPEDGSATRRIRSVLSDILHLLEIA